VEPRDLLKIFQTNAYPLGNTENFGLFPIISRINSACNPNVHFNFDLSRRKATIYCIRKIHRDEEILNCYIDYLMPKSKRISYLFDHFGFKCGCDVCSLRDSAEILDNNQRISLVELDNNIKEAVNAADYKDAYDMLLKKFLLIDKNSFLRNNPTLLYHTELDAYFVCLKINSSLGIDCNRWLESALKHVVLAKGPLSREAVHIKSMMNPN
jgi:hypothetical protein